MKIPDSVTYIGYGAFWGCKNLKEVTIPASVISTSDAPAGSIQRNIFQYCSSLESINVAETNPVFDSRDNCNAVIQKKMMEIFLSWDVKILRFQIV